MPARSGRVTGKLRAVGTRGCAAARGRAGGRLRAKAGGVSVLLCIQRMLALKSRRLPSAKRAPARTAHVKKPVRWEKTNFCQKRPDMRNKNIDKCLNKGDFRVVWGCVSAHGRPAFTDNPFFDTQLSQMTRFLTKNCLFPPDQFFDRCCLGCMLRGPSGPARCCVSPGRRPRAGTPVGRRREQLDARGAGEPGSRGAGTFSSLPALYPRPPASRPRAAAQPRVPAACGPRPQPRGRRARRGCPKRKDASRSSLPALYPRPPAGPLTRGGAAARASCLQPHCPPGPWQPAGGKHARPRSRACRPPTSGFRATGQLRVKSPFPACCSSCALGYPACKHAG